ncbi:unnamed protein product [Mytilus coruscus]|uniref:Kringle domain-containing protein n=1 Tax=Mytilus coruscus TaxID=42192 RepID=A0A6J8AAA8_MYTCO|nr:unnamed protein product [Mytilus coruscus]
MKYFLPDNDEDMNINYCRDNHYYTHGTPWCYTEDPNFRWEFCPVFKCSYFNKTCNDCTMPPVAKPGTTVSYNITYGVVAAIYTCQSFKPGVSVPHCPISTCSNGNHWSEFNISCSDLKLIAKNCEFEHLKDGLIRDRIVCDTNSSRVKERLLREDWLTLNKAVGICRADEESRKQMKTLNEEEQVHALRMRTQNQRTNRNEGYAKKGPSRRDHEKRESNSSFSCGKCGTTHDRRNCPAYEKPKTGKLRICLDPRNLNKAIKREHIALPTIEDITTRLTGAKYLSKLDCNNGYWQLCIDKESQLLTTFNSPFGRYCFLRMPFGIKSAQEVFQKRVSQNLKGVETDIDDILVWGTTRKEHDDRLRSVLNRCQEVGLTLNAEKCKFRVKEVTYIGHTLSADGVRPDQEKIRAIKEMPAPTDKKEVQRLLGTINYLAKFVPNMSAVTEPIRKLLKEEHEFIWTHGQQQAFEKLKDIITKNPVLSFYDVSKPVTVSCDASQCGLGAMLIQDNKPVAYASRSLTDAESRYANIERELLGVLFGLERFNDYTYGKHINVESDHKSLEMIVRKSLGCAPPRLQRMLLRLQKYDFSLKYIPGKDLIVTDMLSRAPIKINTNNEVENDIECFVNMVIRNTSMSDRNLEQITEETSKDDTLQRLTRLIIDDWPDEKNEVPKEVFEYWNFRDELSNVNGIILKGEKIIIPTSMRKNMLNKLHEGHLGIEKTRKLARDFIFWPGINAQITNFISKCSVCLESRRSNTKEPMAESETPELPWMTVGTDIFLLEQ